MQPPNPQCQPSGSSAQASCQRRGSRAPLIQLLLQHREEQPCSSPGSRQGPYLGTLLLQTPFPEQSYERRALTEQVLVILSEPLHPWALQPPMSTGAAILGWQSLLGWFEEPKHRPAQVRAELLLKEELTTIPNTVNKSQCNTPDLAGDTPNVHQGF